MLDERAELSHALSFTLIPLPLASISAGDMSNSLAILSIAFDCGLSLGLHSITFKSIRAMRAGDPIQYPHGTGQLENFSGFLSGAFSSPVTLYIAYFAGEIVTPTVTVFTIS